MRRSYSGIFHTPCACLDSAESYPAGQVEGAERPKVPVTIGRLLRQPIVGVLLVAGMLAAGSLTFLDPTLGPFLERVWHWDVATIGLGFGTCAILYAVVTPFAGCQPCPTAPLSIVIVRDPTCCYGNFQRSLCI